MLKRISASACLPSAYILQTKVEAGKQTLLQRKAMSITWRRGEYRDRQTRVNSSIFQTLKCSTIVIRREEKCRQLSRRGGVSHSSRLSYRARFPVLCVNHAAGYYKTCYEIISFRSPSDGFISPVLIDTTAATYQGMLFSGLYAARLFQFCVDILN